MYILDPIIQSMLEPILTESVELLVCESARFLPLGSGTEKPLLLVHPLGNLVALPLLTRRRLSAPMFDPEISTSGSDSPLRLMLRQATEIIKSVYGEERALRWRDEQYRLMNSVIVAEGVHGMFHGLNGCVKIVEKDEFSRFEITEELQFQFFDGWKTIAHRSTPFGQSPHFFYGWSVKPGFNELYQELINLYDSVDYQPSLPITDMFVWSNQELSSFPVSLIQNSTRDALNTFSPNTNNRGVGILFLSIDPDPSSEKVMTQIEALSLQRSISNLRIMFAPGSLEKKPANNLDIKTLNDVFGTPFEQKCQFLLESLGLLKSHLFEKQADFLFHKDTSDLNKHSFIVLSFECWNGTWANSLDIDGEHIIS